MKLPDHQVAIRSIAGGGEGVGTLSDGRTVFVPRTAPGDVVELAQLRRFPRFARAELGRLVTPGPDRVEPPCPHYLGDRCGSCQLMHLAAPAQRAAKARIVGDALRRIGRLTLDDPEVVAAPSQLGYRSKVTLAWRDGRLGYHRLGEPGSVFEVTRCLLAEAAVDALHQAVRRARHALPPDLDRVALRRDREHGLHVVLEATTEKAWNGGEALHAALGAAGVSATVWWRPLHGVARAVGGAREPWPATVFEQVNAMVGSMVRKAAVAGVDLSPGTGDPISAPGSRVPGREAALVWDLYSGIGESTAMLADLGLAVQSVELDPRAVELATRLGPAGPERFAGAVEGHLRRLKPPAAVLTNPPRTGMSAAVTSAILSSGARRVVYVSCDPATLARDLSRLGAGYRLAAVKAFDQFPQTSHVETVVSLERR